jgi:hypothetical protein
MDNMFSFVSHEGAHIFIYNQSYSPTFYDGFDVSVDTKTDVALSPVFTNRMAAPYSDCVKDIKNYGSVFTNKLTANGMIYRQKVNQRT